MNLLAILRLLSLRHFRRHALRTALALGSVALGVGAFLAMAALNRGVLESFEQTARVRAAGADWTVRAGRAGVPLALAEPLRAVAGVRAAVPLVMRPFALGRGETVEQWNVPLVGLDPATLPEGLPGLPRPAVAAFAAPLALLFGGVPLFLPADFAASWKVAPGDALFVQTPAGRQPARVAATFDAAGVLEGSGMVAVGVPLADAMRLAGLGDRVDSIHLWSDGSRPRAELETALREQLHGRAELEDPATQAREFDATLGSFRLALRFVALLSLVIAAFLVHSTLSMALAERRRELSIVRCLGLTAGRLKALLLAEGAAIGAIGALLGVPLGWLLARTMGALFWETVGQTFDRVEVVVRAPSPSEAALGIAAGLAAALLAVVPPAFAAARLPPIAALTALRGAERTAAHRSRGPALAALACLLLAALSFASDALPLPHGGYLVVGLLVAALALGTQPLLALALRGSGPLLLRCGGVSARLARDHCARAAGSSALTVVAIALGFGLVFSTDVLVKSYVRMLDRWFAANVGEDLLVMGQDFVGSGMVGCDFERGLNRELAAIPGVLHSHGLRFSRIPYAGERVLLFSYDAAGPPESGDPNYVAGDARDEQRLARGEGCFVSEGFARRFGKGRGATVTVAAPEGPLALPVLAVVEDYLWPRGSIWVDDDLYHGAFHDDHVQEFALTLDGTRPLADVQRDVERRMAPHAGALVADAATVQRNVMGIVERYWTLLLAQEGLAVVVAFLGTLHALLVSVLLRRRELALLRALGAPLPLVARMLRTEGALLGFAGGVLALLFGGAAALVALRQISLEEMGFTVAAAPSLATAVATLVAATATGWLAGALPGRRAARAAPRTALLDTMA
ncbi:MAG: ABC transporter permease [Planctomycetes bacterium]|nr:ABC transporter permease [Planctomycetota bacterium]